MSQINKKAEEFANRFMAFVGLPEIFVAQDETPKAEEQTAEKAAAQEPAKQNVAQQAIKKVKRVVSSACAAVKAKAVLGAVWTKKKAAAAKDKLVASKAYTWVRDKLKAAGAAIKSAAVAVHQKLSKFAVYAKLVAAIVRVARAVGNFAKNVWLAAKGFTLRLVSLIKAGVLLAVVALRTAFVTVAAFVLAIGLVIVGLVTLACARIKAKFAAWGAARKAKKTEQAPAGDFAGAAGNA